MAILSYLTTTHFDFGAIRILPKELERLGMHRPLIATDVPGCRAVVDPGVSGFFCEVRSADSLAAAVGTFLALPHEARAVKRVR